MQVPDFCPSYTKQKKYKICLLTCSSCPHTGDCALHFGLDPTITMRTYKENFSYNHSYNHDLI